MLYSSTGASDPLKLPPGQGSLPLAQGGRPRGWAEPREDGTHLAFDTPKRLPDRTPCSLVFLTPRGPEQAGDPRSAAWPTPQWAASHCDRPPATHGAPSNLRDRGHFCGWENEDSEKRMRLSSPSGQGQSWDPNLGLWASYFQRPPERLLCARPCSKRFTCIR